MMVTPLNGAGAAVGDQGVSRKVDVSICVLNFNGAKLLADCLGSLKNIDGATEVSHEVIVVDNGSTDDSVEMLRTRFPGVLVIELDKNISIAEAFNRAIRVGKGRYFLLLNNDILLQKGCLEEMVRFLGEHGCVGAVSARLMNPDGTTQVQYYPAKLPTVRSIAAELLWFNQITRGKSVMEPKGWDPERPCQMEQVPGASMMVRRQVFDEIGLLDASFTCWYEDVDFCFRCFKSGWELWYLPDARVIHLGGATFQGIAISQKTIWRFHGLVRYCSKHFSGANYGLVRMVMFLAVMLRLPIIAVLCVWPRPSVRQSWRGVVPAYLGFLRKVVSYDRLETSKF
jgi:hypothetical protein